MELKGKNVFVSGSSRGIGAQIAYEFAVKGANVILNARKEVAKDLLEKIRATGVSCEVILGDVAKTDDVTRMAQEAIEKLGQIDILVNNAGFTRDSLLIRTADKDFAEVLAVDLGGTFKMTKVFLQKMMKQRSGVIINISSIVGLYGNVGQGSYAASKAGIIGLTKTTAKEGALRNIRCNAIAPGMITTKMTEALDAKTKQAIQEKILLKRFGTPEEIAKTALFLAENDYITGQVITVDGGLAF